MLRYTCEASLHSTTLVLNSLDAALFLTAKLCATTNLTVLGNWNGLTVNGLKSIRAAKPVGKIKHKIKLRWSRVVEWRLIRCKQDFPLQIWLHYTLSFNCRKISQIKGATRIFFFGKLLEVVIYIKINQIKIN